MIRTATVSDASAIASIYNYYVKHTAVTFEELEVTEKNMASRIEETLQKFPWLVYEENERVKGYAYAGAWKTRTAYRFSAEISVYLEHGQAGRGIGTDLYTELLKQLSDLNLHAIIGGMALPNDHSIALHKKFGFHQVAHFQEVGFKFGKWIDVVYFEKILQDQKITQ